MAYTFYVVEITTYNDGTKDALGIYTYSDEVKEIALNLAIASYHGKMSSARKASNVASQTIYVVDPTSPSPLKYERYVAYVAPVVETAEETTADTDTTSEA